MNREWKQKNIMYCFCGTLLLYIATYCAVAKGGELAWDFPIHAEWALSLNRYTARDFLLHKTAYPLWHIVVKILYKWGLNICGAAASATAMFNCCAYWCVGYVWSHYEKREGCNSNIWFWSLLLFFMGPIYAPACTYSYYLGQGTGNTYHNPTNIAVKGAAVLAFAICADIISDDKDIGRKKYGVLSAVLLVSALAKPSFLQGMIPGLGLYFCITIWGKEWKERFWKYFVLATAFIPAVTVIFFQFFISFFGESSEGIGISYGRILYNWTPNLFISFLLAFAFPITVLVIDFRRLYQDKSIRLLICYELCAWLESAFLYEKGAREAHGNWLWGSYISMFIVWMVSLIRFSRFACEGQVTGRQKTVVAIGYAVFFLQVLCGIFYWYTFVGGIRFY